MDLCIKFVKLLNSCLTLHIADAFNDGLAVLDVQADTADALGDVLGVEQLVGAAVVRQGVVAELPALWEGNGRG